MVKYSYLDIILSSFSDGTRRSILKTLDKESLNVTSLYRKICKTNISNQLIESPVFTKKNTMSLPALSKHLKVLENAKLITRNRSGREYKFSLNKQAHSLIKQLESIEKTISEV